MVGYSIMENDYGKRRRRSFPTGFGHGTKRHILGWMSASGDDKYSSSLR